MSAAAEDNNLGNDQGLCLLVAVAPFEQYALSGDAWFEHVVTLVTDIDKCIADRTQGHLVLGSDRASRAHRHVI